MLLDGSCGLSSRLTSFQVLVGMLGRNVHVRMEILTDARLCRQLAANRDYPQEELSPPTAELRLSRAASVVLSLNEEVMACSATRHRLKSG